MELRVTDRYYPELPDDFVGVLGNLHTLINDDPDYLSDPSCPYPVEQARVLGALLSSRGLPSSPSVEQAVDLEFDEDFEVTDEAVLGSIEDLYRQLKVFGRQMDGSTVDPKDKAAYFRMAVALTDKIVAQREKAVRLKDWKQFMGLIMTWLEGVEPDVRTDLIDQIEEWTK